MKRQPHGKRALLNLPGFEGIAAIVAEVENTSGWPKGCDGDGKLVKEPWHGVPEATLTLSDCSRSIDLTLRVEGEDEFKNAVHKVGTMIVALQRLQNGLKVERARYLKRQEIAAEIRAE